MLCAVRSITPNGKGLLLGLANEMGGGVEDTETDLLINEELGETEGDAPTVREAVAVGVSV